MSFDQHISRGVNQVLYKFAPGATFSHPKHNTIERIRYVRAADNERLSLTNNEEIIEEVYRRVQANDGGVQNVLTPNTSNYALVQPGEAYSTIFPRLFACDDCGKLHDYADGGGWDLDDLSNHGGHCLDCGGRLYQIHHVMLCPDCSRQQSLSYRPCSQHRGTDERMILDDSADRYQDFRWVCQACGDNTIDTGVYDQCDTCGHDMIPSVHSASQSYRVQSFTRVDLGGYNVYTATLGDDEVDSLVLGALFELFDREEHSIESLASATSASLSTDPDNLDADELAVIRENVNLGGGGTREVVIADVQERVGDPDVSQNLRDYMMMREALEFDIATAEVSARVDQLCERMGIDSIAVTSEFPLLACSYGYKRTYEDQQADADDDNGDDNAEPAIRMFNQIRVDGDRVLPIYTKQSETEALIIELDPRKVGYWLQQVAENAGMIGQELPDFRTLDRPEARIALYELIGPVETYEDIEIRDPTGSSADQPDIDDVDPVAGHYHPATVMVHRLVHSIAHLCMQNASMYSGIQENNFAEFLFPEALSFAIYAKQTESYTAGGLYTLVNRRLPEWLRGAYQDGGQCFYDSTCADIWGGACHACLHTGEISCQHFNSNLSRIVLYGDRLVDVDYDGFWTTNWERSFPAEEQSPDLT